MSLEKKKKKMYPHANFQILTMPYLLTEITSGILVTVLFKFTSSSLFALPTFLSEKGLIYKCIYNINTES